MHVVYIYSASTKCDKIYSNLVQRILNSYTIRMWCCCYDNLWHPCIYIWEMTCKQSKRQVQSHKCILDGFRGNELQILLDTMPARNGTGEGSITQAFHCTGLTLSLIWYKTIHRATTRGGELHSAVWGMATNTVTPCASTARLAADGDPRVALLDSLQAALPHGQW